MEISIIIPTYNEESCIDDTLHKLSHLKSNFNYVKEIIVVDAGSEDATQRLVRAHPAVKLLKSKKGRPLQMNFGAKSAHGSILYFLHADSLPPKDYDVYIVNSIKANRLAGCFRMQFDSVHPWMKFISWLTKFRYKACRGGDQSLFVSRTLFEDVGGFDESYLIFEDHEIVTKLYAKTRFNVIQKKLLTSSRRFKDKGILKLQILFGVLYVKKWLGTSPDSLYSFYSKYVN